MTEPVDVNAEDAPPNDAGTGPDTEPSDGLLGVDASQSDGLLGVGASQSDGLLGTDASQSDGLLGRIEVIEAQPLAQRAAGFDQLAEELLAELQRADHEGAR